MWTSIRLSHFPFINRLLLGDFFGLWSDVCPLVLLVHLARFVVVLMGLPFPMADPAPTMLPPVLGKAQRGISNSPRLLSLAGWCFPPLALVMTIRFCVVGYEHEEVCILMIFPSHVLPAGLPLSISGPWILTSVSADFWIFLDGPIGWIVAALVVPVAQMALEVSLGFGFKLQFHSHVLDYGVQAHEGWDNLHPQLLPTSPLNVVEPQQTSSGRVPKHLDVDRILHGDHPVGLSQVSLEIFHDTRMLIFWRHNAYSPALLCPSLFFVLRALL